MLLFVCLITAAILRFCDQSYPNSLSTYYILINIFIVFRDPVDDLVVRTISSQLKFRSINGQAFLNWCFEALAKYFPDWNYPYIVIDGNPQTKSDWFRIRSRIFKEDGDSIPLCLIQNTHCK